MGIGGGKISKEAEKKYVLPRLLVSLCLLRRSYCTVSIRQKTCVGREK